MIDAKSYTNTPAPLHLTPSGFTIYVKRLGFVDILAVCERLVIATYVEEQKPYLAQLQPRGAVLHHLALNKILDKEGVAAILEFGLLECNPDMNLEDFLARTTPDERGQVFEIFCADITEMGDKVVEDKKEDGKKPPKKAATKKKKTGARSQK
jgi:hypothetical protein